MIVVGGRRCVRHTDAKRCTAPATHRVQIGTYAGAYFVCASHVQGVLEREVGVGLGHNLRVIVDEILLEPLEDGSAMVYKGWRRIANIIPKLSPWRP